MLDTRSLKLLKALKSSPCCSSHQLCELLQVSEKTCRNALRQLSDVLQDKEEPSGAEIKAIRGKGYRLDVNDQQLFNAWQQRFLSRKSTVPQSPAERARYIIRILMFADHTGMKRQVLCEKLYVSEKTISADLRVVETMIAAFGLRLDRTKTGVRISGAEQQKRQCLLGILYNTYQLQIKQNTHQVALSRHIASVVQQESDGAFSEYGIQLLVDYLIVSKHRMDCGFLCDNDAGKTNDIGDSLARRIIETLERDGTLQEVPDGEVRELQHFIDSRLTNEGGDLQKGITVTPLYIYKLADRIIRSIQDRYDIKMINDELFARNLQEHLAGLDRRMRYGVHITTPIYRELRRKYVLAYMLAQQAAMILKDYYQQIIPEVEIELLTMLIELFRDDGYEVPSRANVLLVLPHDVLSSIYLFFLLAKEFNNIFNRVYICNVQQSETYDITDIDIVITVTNFDRPVSIPVWHISDVMTPAIRDQIIALWRGYEFEKHKQIIEPELFFTDIRALSYEEAIINLCFRARNVIDLPRQFVSSVLYRETMGSSDLGYLSALPHPDHIMTDKPLFIVGILEKPILWMHQEVQLVILTSFPNNDANNCAYLASRIERLVTNADRITSILKKQTFESFINELMLV